MTSMQEQGRCFAEVVNEAFARIFDELLNNEDLHQGTEAAFARGLEKRFAQAQTDWYLEPAPSLRGRSLNEFLQSLDENDFLAFLQGFLEKLDYDYPAGLEPLVAALSASGRAAWLAVITARSAQTDINSEAGLEAFYLLRQFLPLAAAWKDEQASRILLDWFLQAEEPDERSAEALGRYFRLLGSETAELLGERIRAEVKAGRADRNGTDYLLQDLTAICRADEELLNPAYLVLREAFRGMKKKQIPAICLGDLGSVRAIPLLRAYIEREYKSIERSLYYDILSSIQRLGGSTKDLPDPFGDFSGQGDPGAFRLEM